MTQEVRRLGPDWIGRGDPGVIGELLVQNKSIANNDDGNAAEQPEMTASQFSRRRKNQSQTQQEAPTGYDYQITRAEWERRASDRQVKNERGNPVGSARRLA